MCEGPRGCSRLHARCAGGFRSGDGSGGAGLMRRSEHGGLAESGSAGSDHNHQWGRFLRRVQRRHHLHRVHSDADPGSRLADADAIADVDLRAARAGAGDQRHHDQVLPGRSIVEAREGRRALGREVRARGRGSRGCRFRGRADKGLFPSMPVARAVQGRIARNDRTGPSVAHGCWRRGLDRRSVSARRFPRSSVEASITHRRPGVRETENHTMCGSASHERVPTVPARLALIREDVPS